MRFNNHTPLKGSVMIEDPSRASSQLLTIMFASVHYVAGAAAMMSSRACPRRSLLAQHQTAATSELQTHYLQRWSAAVHWVYPCGCARWHEKCSKMPCALG
jgi:hypothetical protein